MLKKQNEQRQGKDMGKFREVNTIHYVKVLNYSRKQITKPSSVGDEEKVNGQIRPFHCSLGHSRLWCLIAKLG